MKIALAQMKLSHNIELNLKKTINFMKIASENGADLISFPELQLTPFFPQYENAPAEKYLMKSNSKYLTEIRKACLKYNIYATPNLYIWENSKTYDMSFLIDNNGQIIGKQKMVHIKQAEKFYEKSYYTPSDEGFKVFQTEFGKIAIIICFDRHYPESIRTATLNGAQLIIVPTANTTNENTELFKWEMKVQSFQNNVIIAMINRVGVEDEMEFNGQSIVSDINGDTIALAGSNEEILYANIDLNKSDKKEYLHLRRNNYYF